MTHEVQDKNGKWLFRGNFMQAEFFIKNSEKTRYLNTENWTIVKLKKKK